MQKKNFKEYQDMKYLRARQLAEHLKVSESTIWSYVRQGKIVAKKVSDRITLFEVKAVESALFGA